MTELIPVRAVESIDPAKPTRLTPAQAGGPSTFDLAGDPHVGEGRDSQFARNSGTGRPFDRRNSGLNSRWR